MSAKPKILVTGGAGYIGSHTIVELLRSENYDVVSADNFSNSTDKTFDRIKRITGHEVTNYNVDLTDISASRKIFEDHEFEAVIHFAAYKSVGESVEEPDKYWHNNQGSLKNILTLQEEFNVKALVFSSSCSVYGNSEQLPAREDAQLPDAESPYGATKQAGEVTIKEFCEDHREHGAVALRYFNPVGADESGMIGEDPGYATQNLVPIINQVAIGKRDSLTVFGTDYNTPDGTCLRDYIHVTDLAQAHILAISHIAKMGENNYDVFNLGLGKGISVTEMIDSFERVTGVSVNHSYGPRRAGDAEAIYGDCTKSNNVLGWTPKLGLDDMMTTSWAWEQNMEKGF